MESVVQTLEDINVDLLLEEWNKIKTAVRWSNNQTAVHYRKQDVDTHIDPCGWHVQEYRERGGLAWQQDYTLLNKEYKNTYIEHLLNKYQVYRARVLVRPSNSCYLWHCDTEKRIHIPLYSDHGNFFAFEGEGLKRLEVGSVYLVDTTKMHTFFNGSKKDRTHIVGCTLWTLKA